MIAALSGLDAVAVAAALLIGAGVHGLVATAHLLRRVVALNVVGSGIFLLSGAFAARGGGAADPVPQALIITGIVVGLSVSTLAIGLVLAHGRESSGRMVLDEDGDHDDGDDEDGATRHAVRGGPGRTGTQA